MSWSTFFCCYENKEHKKSKEVEELIIRFDLTYLTIKPYCPFWKCNDKLSISNVNELDFALIRINELGREMSKIEKRYDQYDGTPYQLYLNGNVHVYGKLNNIRYELHTGLLSQLIEILENAKGLFEKNTPLKITT